jgi:radical SAM protein with 4Fe4S-binding SPASM domain
MLKYKKRRSKLLKFLRVTKLPYLPFILGIEPGNVCNLSCPLCPTGKGDKELRKGFMEFSLFKDIFDQLNNALTEVYLFNWGEPLLNNDLCEMIKYVKFKDSKVRIVTSTNLNIVQKEKLTDLLKSGIDEIIISCDGASQNSYVQYRVGGNFDLVMENMRYLVSEKRRLAVKTCVVWNFIVFKHNEHEVEQARQMASLIGVDFRVGLMRTSMKDEILKPHSEAIKQDIAWIPDNPKYSAYDKEELKTRKQLQTCRKLWQEISINWDGKVFPCCAVYGEGRNFGDASKQPIKEIWNNNYFIRARKEVLNKRLPVNTICGVCRNNGFMHM